MKLKNFYFLLLTGLLATAALTFTSCGDDDDPVLAPTVALSATDFSGKTGETASVTATVTAPGGLKNLVVTKYIGTDIDANFGTGGSKSVTTLTHTEDYVLSGEGLTSPIRFNFTAEDNEGQTGSADFIITTEASVSYLLTNFDWQWNSKLGKCLDADPETEQILDCEKDNVYSFNGDGTFTLDFGALTGSGGGTCDFDGLAIPTTWELSADETILTISTANAFDPTDITSETFTIVDASSTAMNSTQTVDLTAFGCVIWDWKFEWVAKPK